MASIPRPRRCAAQHDELKIGLRWGSVVTDGQVLGRRVQFEFGDFLLDDAARRVTRRGEPVRLAPKAFDLLKLLVEERPRAIRKQELQERLWPDVIVDEANLKNLVGEIRAALGEDRWIRTVQRFGYAFDAPGEEASRGEARLVAQDRVHRLAAGENVIGRDDDCGVVFDFAGVSRRHARITVGNDLSMLEDLGSKNGTWKNDERVTSPVRLDDGDRIRLGAMVLMFRAGPAAATASLNE